MATSNGSRDQTLTVGIKTSGESALRDLAQEVRQLAKAGGDAAPAYQNLASQLDRLADQAAGIGAFKQLAADVDALTERQREAGAAAAELQSKLAGQQAETQRFATAQAAAARELREARDALQQNRSALDLLNAETARADRTSASYLQQVQALRTSIVNSKDAVYQKRQALNDANAALSAAEAAESKLESAYGRSARASANSATALERTRSAMQEAGLAAQRFGADISDVAAAEQALLATQQRLVAEVAEQRVAAIREQSQADREAVLSAQALADARQAGVIEAQSELAAIRDSEEFLRRYAKAQQEAAAAAIKSAEEQAAAEKTLQALRLQSLNDTIRQRQAATVAAAKQAEAEERLNVAAEKTLQALRLQSLNDVIRVRQAAALAAQELARAESNAAEQSERLASASERAGLRLREAFGQTGVRSLQAIDAEVRRVNISVDQLERQFRAGAISAQDLARAVSSAQVRLAQLNREAETIPALPGAFERLSSSINSAINRFGALGAAIATVGVAVKPVLDATIELERMSRVLTTVTGSSAEAARQIEFLRNVSQRAGQSFSEVGNEYAKFAAAALGAGVSLTTVQKTFETVALAAGNLGLSTDQTSRILNALGQSASKGVIQMEELRGQLGDALPGAMSLLAKGLGLTDAQLIKVIESGNLLARDALPALGEALVKLGPKEGQGVTGLVAEFNRLKNVVLEASTILTESAFGKAAGATLAGLGAAIERVSFGVAYIGESFTVVGRQIGATVAAIVTGDLKNLGAALDEIALQSTEKLAGLAARIDGTGTSAVQAAAGAKTLGDSMREATLQIGKVAEAQATAGAATAAAGQQALDASVSWVQLSVKLAESVSVAEKAAVVADTVAKAKKIEAEAAAAVVAISGDEILTRGANARAAASEAAALEVKAAADALVAQRLREGVAALEERARAEGRVDDATKKALDTQRQNLAAKEADAEKSRQQADAARVHAQALDIQARALQDNSGKVELYRAELDRATSALASAITLMGRDKATKDDVREATEAVAKAEALLKDAISDRAKRTEQAIEVMKLDHQIKRAGIQVQIEESRAAQVLAQARGDELAVAQEVRKQKELEIQLARDSVAMTLEEAQSRKEAAEAELRDITNLTPEKRLELELRIKNAQAKIAEAQAGAAAVRVIEAERTALIARNQVAGSSSSSGSGGSSAAGPGASSRAPGSTSTGSGANSTAGKIDGSGLDSFNASLQKPGNTAFSGGPADASYTFDLLRRFQAGQVGADELPAVRNALEVAKNNARLGSAGSVSLEGRAQDQKLVTQLQAVVDYLEGLSTSSARIGPRPSAGAGATPASAPAAAAASASPAAAPAGVRVVRVEFGNSSASIATASEADAQNLEALLQQLAAYSRRAA